MVKRASRTSDLSRLRMLARVARDYRETQRLLAVAERGGVRCTDLRARLDRLGTELDEQVRTSFLATRADQPALPGLLQD